MNKLLVICGPTATGKTALALHLAKVFRGNLISADSRQVYRGMDIITNKGLPKGKKIYLTDLVDPKKDFSVSQWRKEAKKVISQLQKDKKLPIVVGGTGLYIESLIKNIESINIPPNKKLRNEMEGKSVDELYETLAHVDAVRAANMNQSDKKNPRRLLRAIEVAVGGTRLRTTVYGLQQNNKKAVVSSQSTVDMLIIGLTAPKEALLERIAKRVDERLKKGALSEVKHLLTQRDVSWDAQSMTGIGYRELKPYFEKREKLEVCIKNWIKAEQRYARRQLTWFKKYKELKWFDVSQENWRQEVEILVRNWYNIDKF